MSGSTNVFGASLSRRGFVQAGGALLAGFALAGKYASADVLNPARPESWIEIHEDNTILMRTGKSDFGQGTIFTAYRQIVAEELSAPFAAITRIMIECPD